MQTKVLVEEHVSIIKVEEGPLRANHINDEWICPLCTSDRDAVYLREESAIEHIEQTHLKSKVPYGGYIIAKCGLQCDPDKKKFHYHCVECGKIIFSRGDFFYHLKGHEAQKGLKSRRGRKKGYASLAQSLGQTELFSSVAVVLSPQMMGLLPDDKDEFLLGLQSKTGATCTVNEENIYVLTGAWSSIVQARSMLEELAVRKLEEEKKEELVPPVTDFAATPSVSLPVSSAMTTGEMSAPVPQVAIDPNEDVVSETDDEPEEDDGEFDPEDGGGAAALALSSGGGGRHYSSQRRSSRKRKINRNYEDYVLPSKISKEDEESPLKSSDSPIASQTNDGDFVVNVVISSMMSAADGGSAGAGDRPDSSLLELDPSELGYASDAEIELDEDVLICQTCGDTFAGKASFDEHRSAGQCRDPAIATAAADSVVPPHSSDEAEGAAGAEELVLQQCPDCDYKVERTFEMKMHRLRQHEPPRYECSVCHKKFGPLYDLKLHMKWVGHGVEKATLRQTEQCHICNKIIQAKNLKQHVLQVHEKQKPFHCEICTKAFGTRYLVREHMESHKDKDERPRPFRCETCGQGFYKKLPLDEHMTKHEGKPQYRCDLCGKQFFHSSGHKRHLQHHSSERPFHCQVCGKSFKTSTNLSAHKSVHRPQTFACGCGKTYQQRHTLKSHQDKCTVHQTCLANQIPEEQFQQLQRYMCGYCQETFGDFAAVQEHLVLHVEDGSTGSASSAVAGDASTMQVEATEIDASTLQQLAETAAGDGGLGIDSTDAVGASSLVQLALTAASSSSLEHLAVAAASELDSSAGVQGTSIMTVNDDGDAKPALGSTAETVRDAANHLVQMMELHTS